MRRRQMSVRLVLSQWMDERAHKEDGRIRIPKRARNAFQVSNDRVVIRTEKHTAALEVKSAKLEDVQDMKAQLKAGKITDEQSRMTAFVTSNTLRAFVGRKRKDLEEFCYLSEGIDNLFIGADPEFGIIEPTTKMLLYAQHTKLLKKTSVLGHDGPLAEVRPPPAQSIEGIIKNIGDVLNKNRGPIDHLDWTGGASYKSPGNKDKRVYHIGGHIHLGDPSLLPSTLRTPVYQRMCQVLDEIVAMPLVRIDTPDPASRRNTAWNGYGRYGRAGDHKAQGSARSKDQRMEWRVLSGLWLVHPEIAAAVLGTSKAVAESVYQLIADQKFDPTWISARSTDKGLLKYLGSLEKSELDQIINVADPKSIDSSLLRRGITKLRDLPTYEEYKDEVEAFIDIITVSDKDRKNINLDVKAGWLSGASLIKG